MGAEDGVGTSTSNMTIRARLTCSNTTTADMPKRGWWMCWTTVPLPIRRTDKRQATRCRRSIRPLLGPRQRGMGLATALRPSSSRNSSPWRAKACRASIWICIILYVAILYLWACFGNQRRNCAWSWDKLGRVSGRRAVIAVVEARFQVCSCCSPMVGDNHARPLQDLTTVRCPSRCSRAEQSGLAGSRD